MPNIPIQNPDDKVIYDAVKRALQWALKIVRDVTDPKDNISPGTQLLAATEICNLLVAIDAEKFDIDNEYNDSPKLEDPDEEEEPDYGSESE